MLSLDATAVLKNKWRAYRKIKRKRKARSCSQGHQPKEKQGRVFLL